MRLLIWIFRLFLFLLLFGFAVKNDDVVVLRFFFGTQWHVPLVLVILSPAVWVKVDSFSLLQAIGYLASRLSDEFEVREVDRKSVV